MSLPYSGARFLTADKRRQRSVDHVARRLQALAFEDGSAMGTAMLSSTKASTTKAGGCFLTLCILAGFPLGLAIGDPMKGILIGTGTGIIVALIVWLIDRRRG